MIISNNRDPHKEEFEHLLNSMVTTLKEDASLNMNKYLKYSSSDVEKLTKDVLDWCAKGTPFEDTIELIAGQNFPDIIAYKYYGVEVKTTKSNMWKSTGSSVAEGTRVKDIERIFMLFGKMSNPVDFKCKPYEDCLSGVVVTHSPRYMIDMNLNIGETFFDKINIPYDTLRCQENPINTILDYYRAQLKPGQTTWWAQSGNSKNSNIIVRLWSSLSTEEKQEIKIKALCLFPEILGNNQNKYNRMNLWLASVQGVVVPNVRDLFSAGGQRIIEYNNTEYLVPKTIFNLCHSIDEIFETLYTFDFEELMEYWEIRVNPIKIKELWIDMISNHAGHISNFPLKKYIISYIHGHMEQR